MDGERQMVKPMTLIREEFITNLVELINSSSLPYFIIEDILKNFLNEIHMASLHQIEMDKKRFSQEISKLNNISNTVDDDERGGLLNN